MGELTTNVDTSNGQSRPVRSFKGRRRTLSPARQQQFDEWMLSVGLDEVGPAIDFAVEFGRPSDVVLDIGVGHGESTIELASARPDVDVIAIEVHTPGVAVLLETVTSRSLANVRVVHGDAVAFLDRVGTETLAGAQVLFPDPWPKARHRSRRLVDACFVTALTERLRPEGWLAFATDDDAYADAMRLACASDPRLVGRTRPLGRTPTRYQRRALSSGRRITELQYQR